MLHGMFSRTPLLSRLRHRSLGAGWLFALLIVLKVAVATVCLATDAVAAPAPFAAQTAQIDQIQTAAFETDSASTGAVCWHADTGDCHCSCLHAVPLSGHADVGVAKQSPTSVFLASLQALNTPPTQNELRPPIA